MDALGGAVVAGAAEDGVDAVDSFFTAGAGLVGASVCSMPSMVEGFIGGGLELCNVSLGGPNGLCLAEGGAGEAGADVTDMGGWNRDCCDKCDCEGTDGGSIRELIEGEALARFTTRAGGETGGMLLAWEFCDAGTVEERIGSYSWPEDAGRGTVEWAARWVRAGLGMGSGVGATKSVILDCLCAAAEDDDCCGGADESSLAVFLFLRWTGGAFGSFGARGFLAGFGFSSPFCCFLRPRLVVVVVVGGGALLAWTELAAVAVVGAPEVATPSGRLALLWLRVVDEAAAISGGLPGGELNSLEEDSMTNESSRNNHGLQQLNTKSSVEQLERRDYDDVAVASSRARSQGFKEQTERWREMGWMRWRVAGDGADGRDC